MVSTLALWPWQQAVLPQALKALTAPAALLYGAAGQGQLNLAFQLAKAWLCEGHPEPGGMFDDTAADPTADMGVPPPACGQCPACHLVDTGYHPDLMLVVPDNLVPRVGWAHLEEALDKADKGEGRKRKLSPEIKVDAIREVVGFSQSTVSRGRAKVVLICPADRMNTVSANTLLKTLEEPPGHVRFILACGPLDDVLPTVRSRCQAWQMPSGTAADVAPWLVEQIEGLSAEDGQSLLAAAGGSPEGALELHAMGWSAGLWHKLPADLKAGRVGAWGQWPLPLLLGTLQKLAHDMARVAVGAPALYFPQGALPQGAGLPQVTAWGQELRKAMRHAEHPFNAPLKAESLIFQARRALAKA
ncbi:MAG: polymerase subunit delta [Pseudomonadota bacterium]